MKHIFSILFFFSIVTTVVGQTEINDNTNSKVYKHYLHDYDYTKLNMQFSTNWIQNVTIDLKEATKENKLEDGYHYIFFNDTDVLALEGLIIEGKLDGEWKAYYFNGNIKYRLRFEKGITDGVLYCYTIYGKVIEESFYYKNKIIGKVYYPNYISPIEGSSIGFYSPEEAPRTSVSRFSSGDGYTNQTIFTNYLGDSIISRWYYTNTFGETTKILDNGIGSRSLQNKANINTYELNIYSHNQSFDSLVKIVSKIKDYPNLHILNLSNSYNEPRVDSLFQTIDFHPKNTTLIKVTLSQTHIPKSILNKTSIKTLYLDCIPDIQGIKKIKKLDNLVFLSIQNKGLNEDDILSAVSKIKNLEAFEFGSTDATLSKNIRKLKNISRLAFVGYYEKPSNDCFKLNNYIFNLTQLKYLQIDICSGEGILEDIFSFCNKYNIQFSYTNL